LEPARYSLTAKAAGFKTFESDNLDVAADTALSLGKMPLAPGALTEEIAVTAAATPVQTASSENSRLADSSQVNDLTLKGRDLFGALAVAGPQMAPAGSGGAAAAGAAPVARVAAGKLDPTLVALVRGGARGGPAGAGGRARESRLVSGGEVNVRITLTNASKDSLAQLRKAGFTIIHQARNELTGHVAVEKLEAVAQLAFVVWIAPQ